MGPVATIAAVLQRRIVEIAKWAPFQELHVVFEQIVQSCRSPGGGGVR